jgi:hypothetical protein
VWFLAQTFKIIMAFVPSEGFPSYTSWGSSFRKSMILPQVKCAASFLFPCLHFSVAIKWQDFQVTGSRNLHGTHFRWVWLAPKFSRLQFQFVLIYFWIPVRVCLEHGGKQACFIHQTNIHRAPTGSCLTILTKICI